MEKEEYLIKLQILEQQANQFSEQLKIINQQTEELNILKSNLSTFEKTGKKEIYAEFGKGIFISGTMDKGKYLVDVGNKIFVPKTSSEINKIISEQINKFESFKPQVSEQIDMINKELDKLTNDIRKGNDKEKQVKKDNNKSKK